MDKPEQQQWTSIVWRALPLIGIGLLLCLLSGSIARSTLSLGLSAGVEIAVWVGLRLIVCAMIGLFLFRAVESRLLVVVMAMTMISLLDSFGTYLFSSLGGKNDIGLDFRAIGGLVLYKLPFEVGAGVLPGFLSKKIKPKEPKSN
jgi:hypothetical protein